MARSDKAEYRKILAKGSNVDGSEHIESNALLDSIAKIVGDKGIIRDPADIEPYIVDQRKA